MWNLSIFGVNNLCENSLHKNIPLIKVLLWRIYITKLNNADIYNYAISIFVWIDIKLKLKQIAPALNSCLEFFSRAFLIPNNLTAN